MIETLNMASCETTSPSVSLNENDIPGASLLGRKPEELKVEELKFWLKCRGDSGKGLKTKAELAKRYIFLTSSSKCDVLMINSLSSSN